MIRPSHRQLLAYLLLALLAAALTGCGGSPAEEPPKTAPSPATGADRIQGVQTGVPANRSSQQHLAQLGITGEPNRGEPRGLLVTGFVSSSESAPLGVIGVKQGDVIVSCNGRREQIGLRLVAAIDGLRESGNPVVLVVMRDGKQVTLERTEKLPESQTDQTPE